MKTLARLLFAVLFFANFAPAAHAALTTNGQGYWKFDEASGNASDSSPNSYTLTNNGTTGYVSGIINNAVSITTSSTFFSIADGSSANLAFSGDFSISLWMNIPTLTRNHVYCLVVKFAGASRGYEFYYVAGATAAADTIDLDLSADGSTTVELHLAGSQTALDTANQWNHLVMTYKASTGTATYYVNGSSVGTVSGGPASIFHSTAAFKVGNGDFISFDQPVKIDELGVWNTTLTSGDVTTLYNGGVGLQWPFTTATAAVGNLLTFFGWW